MQGAGKYFRVAWSALYGNGSWSGRYMSWKSSLEERCTKLMVTAATAVRDGCRDGSDVG